MGECATTWDALKGTDILQCCSKQAAFGFWASYKHTFPCSCHGWLPGSGIHLLCIAGLENPS